MTIPEGSSRPRGIRLQAYLASCGVASRRACEGFIRDGRVSVDGRIVTEMGFRVPENARIEVDGRPVEPEAQKRYLVLNKPRGVLSALSDPHMRPVASDILRPRVAERVYNIGRLDYDSEGLLLFTNDGEFARIVGHPSGGIEKEYRVRTDRDVPEDFERAFLRGIPEGGQILRALRAERENSRTLRVVLVEGRNREVRRALDAFGIAAVRLTRIRIGPVEAAGLEPGDFRDLTEEERRKLLENSAEKTADREPGASDIEARGGTRRRKEW